ncbi:hypothetical protein [Polyangium sp. 6x1]|uniref:hypothetical protein n=1 Tax=Polyangium sp. 6x1 TaxID=3042689 RepID=UPI002482DE2C|nr:hypothetical protein [Polyangium sp. 6x1]MDI1448042.1 hypothetical protein [Polyangium sp. 6x1]
MMQDDGGGNNAGRTATPSSSVGGAARRMINASSLVFEAEGPSGLVPCPSVRWKSLLPTRQELLANAVDLARSENVTTPFKLKEIVEWTNRAYLAPQKVTINVEMLRDRLNTPTSLEEAAALARPRLLKRLNTKETTVICEMWDTETKRWYAGRSGHGRAQGKVPISIWKRIPDVNQADRSDWAFGKNCAEVECIIEAYKEGKTAPDLRGCYFIAFHIPDNRVVGPCRTCKKWVPSSGGQAAMPK